MRIGSAIHRNEKGNYNLQIAGFSVVTMKERHQAEAVRKVILENEVIYRMLGEYSASDLVERTFEYPSQIVSDEKHRKLRFIWGPDKETEWNMVVAPKLMEKLGVDIQDEADPAQ